MDHAQDVDTVEAGADAVKDAVGQPRRLDVKYAGHGVGEAGDDVFTIELIRGVRVRRAGGTFHVARAPHVDRARTNRDNTTQGRLCVGAYCNTPLQPTRSTIV